MTEASPPETPPRDKLSWAQIARGAAAAIVAIAIVGASVAYSVDLGSTRPVLDTF